MQSINGDLNQDVYTIFWVFYVSIMCLPKLPQKKLDKNGQKWTKWIIKNPLNMIVIVVTIPRVV